MRNLRYPLLIFLLGILLYSPIFTAGFAADDYPQLVQQPFLHQLNAAYAVFYKVIASPYGNNKLTGFFYRPLTFSIYTIIYNLSQANPIYFHLLQVIIYLGTVYLLYIFFTNYFSKNISLLLSTIFLIHPANNELASYISAFADTLSLFFGLLALNILLKIYSPNQTANHKTTKQSTLLVSFITLPFILLFSLFAKETGVLFIMLSLIYIQVLSQTRNIIHLKSSLQNFLKNFNYKLIAVILPLAIYLVFRISASGHAMFHYLANSEVPKSLQQRLLLAPQIALTFLTEILAPTRKALRPHSFQPNFTNAFLDTSILLCILFAYIVTWKWFEKYSKEKLLPLSTFFFWIILGMILYLQIIPLEFLFAERWVYITEIGILGTFGCIISSVSFKKSLWTIICVILFIVLLLLYAGETVKLNFMWHNWQRYLA